METQNTKTEIYTSLFLFTAIIEPVKESTPAKKIAKEKKSNKGIIRYYDPVIGVWASTDKAEQFWSPYAYTGNGYNPLNGTDPDGNTYKSYAYGRMNYIYRAFKYKAAEFMMKYFGYGSAAATAGCVAMVGGAQVTTGYFAPIIVSSRIGMTFNSLMGYYKGMTTFSSAFKFALPVYIASKKYPVVGEINNEIVTASGNNFLDGTFKTIEFGHNFSQGLVDQFSKTSTYDGPAPNDVGTTLPADNTRVD